MDRRTVLGWGMGAGAAALLGSRAWAETVDENGIAPSDPKEIVALWPSTPPCGQGLVVKDHVGVRQPLSDGKLDRYIDHVGRPMFSVCRPEKPNGAAVLIAPGGGYTRVVFDHEGFSPARFFNALGITAFVLRYRLPGDGWDPRRDVPLQDIQRAMRLIRANAAQYAVDPARLGVLGFSAGGHLVCSLATRYGASVYAPVDTADAQDARPAFVCALYPVVTMMAGTHAGSRDNLLGPNPSPALLEAYSCETLVTEKTSPTFVALAADDTVVPPMPNGVAFFNALQKARVASELHIFERGGHGFGLSAATDTPAGAWPPLFLRWAASHGFF